MTLYIPVGIPGSGKTHLGSLWFSTEIVCPDEIREWLTDDMSDQRCNSLVFDIAHKVVEARMRRGLDVYFDATNLNPDLWPNADFGQSRVFILMDTPIDVCYERNNLRDRVVPQEAMDRMRDRFLHLRDGKPAARLSNWVLSSEFRRD